MCAVSSFFDLVNSPKMTESRIYRISFAFLSSLPRHIIVSPSLFSESYTKEKREKSGFDSTHFFFFYSYFVVNGTFKKVFVTCKKYAYLIV